VSSRRWVGWTSKACGRTYLADDVVLELPFAPPGLGPKRVIGLDTVVATMARAPSVYDSLAFTLIESYPIPSKDTVILRAMCEGALKVGGRYTNEYMQLFTFRGRKVSLWIEFFDALRVVEMLSVLSSA
jgi:ketosteroid isomerase-like protein